MEDISLHILDVAENSTAAEASLLEIVIIQNTADDILKIMIKDNGRGMDEVMAKNVSDPFVTTRTTRRVGLGIPLLAQSAQEADGEISVKSVKGKGTEITATFKCSHIDRKPLGDIASTIITIILGNPDIDIVYQSDFDGTITEIDTREIKSELESVSITEPAVLELIRNTINDKEN